MTNTFPLKLVDRTRTVQDWKCPRSRFLGYELYGRGITSKGTNLDLFIGIVVHDALAAIATLHDKENFSIDEIANAAHKQVREAVIEASLPVVDDETRTFATEQAVLTEGMIRGFYKHMWPKLMAQFPKVVAIEAEMEYHLGDGLCFMTKPDLIVETPEGDLVYLEYKTTSTKKEAWINSWQTAVQLHSSIKAVGQTLGKDPTYVQIVGLYKGFESYGKQSSPFCYAYFKEGKPPFIPRQISYEWKAGFKRTPTWELPGGLKQWVEEMPENILTDQFPMTPPIMVDDELVESFFAQRSRREAEIQKALQDIYDTPGDADIIMEEAFPQRFDQCIPSFGSPCQFRKICHGKLKDPLKDSYVYRIPHHEREIESQRSQEATSEQSKGLFLLQVQPETLSSGPSGPRSSEEG